MMLIEVCRSTRFIGGQELFVRRSILGQNLQELLERHLDLLISFVSKSQESEKYSGEPSPSIKIFRIAINLRGDQGQQ